MHMKHTNNKQLYIVILKYVRLYIVMVVIYCYLEKDKDKDLKFHMSNFAYFEINTSLF